MAIDKKDYPNKIKAGLFANKGFREFYYVFTYEKKKYRGLFNYNDRLAWNKRTRVAEAEKELLRLREEKHDGVGDGRITLDKYFYAHYVLLEDTAWNKTLKSHYLRYVSPSIGSKQIGSIFNHHIKIPIKEQRDLGLSPRTIKQTIEALAPVFKDAMINRIIRFNPLDGIVVKRDKTKMVVSHGGNEIKRIYNAICDAFDDDPYAKAYYLFALQGRRRGEIQKMLTNDVSIEHEYYIIREVKNGETQKMFLPAEIAELLKVFVDFDKTWVFMSMRTDGHVVNMEKRTRKLKDRLGEEFSLKYLRNVIVSAMGEAGASGTDMSGASGHNNINTLDKYLNINYAVGSKKASDTISDLVKCERNG